MDTHGKHAAKRARGIGWLRLVSFRIAVSAGHRLTVCNCHFTAMYEERAGGLGKCRWLEAFWQPDARINALPGGLETFTVSADSEARFIAADIGTIGRPSAKIRVYKGDEQVTEHNMVDVPCGLVGLYTENGEARSAVLAVAAGPGIFVFKNMRPYFKYCLPHIDAHPRERDIWHKAGLEDDVNPLTLADDLALLLKELGATLVSARTLKFLTMDTTLRASFAEEYKRIPLARSNVLTAIGMIRRDTWSDPACGCLVIGTENGEIVILDTRAFTPMDKYQCDWVAVEFASAGLWAGDGHIVIVGRDGKVGAVKKGNPVKVWDRLSAPAVAVTTLATDGAAVAVMDGSLIGYSKKGTRLWRVHVSDGILDMIGLPVPQSGLSLLAVSTMERSGVRIYDGKHHVDTVNTIEPVAAIKYGRMGQEERAMVIVTVNGGLAVKILKRTADFSNRRDSVSGNCPNGIPKFVVPRKSRLFVEQTIRERSEAVKIHGAFQAGFLRLALAVANKAVEVGANQKCNATPNPISVEADVLGLGPNYLIRLTLTNISERISNVGLFVLCRNENAHVEPPLVDLSLLPPGTPMPLVFQARLKSRLPGKVQIFVCKRKLTDPLAVTSVVLPAVEDNDNV